MERSKNLGACSYRVCQRTHQERSSSAVHQVVEHEDVRVPQHGPSEGAYPEACYGIPHGGHHREEGFDDACLDEGTRPEDVVGPCDEAECLLGALGIVALIGVVVWTGLVGQGRHLQVLS